MHCQGYNFISLYSHTLHTLDAHTQCNRTLALFALFDQIIPGPNKIAVIGSGCSVATEPTAEVSHFYNITQVRRCNMVKL